MMKKFVIGVILLVGLVVAIAMRQQPSDVSTSGSFEDMAKAVVKKCARDAYRSGCYDKEIPKLMGRISMEDAFSVTRFVQRHDPSYAYCHVLGHKLSAQETQKDPTKWKEVVGRCPVGVCSNGCVHGAFQEKFREEKLDDTQIGNILPDLKSACEARPGWNPTGMQQATCYHALGHLLMYITDADLVKSTTLCKQIAIKPDGRDLSGVCFDGAFMQMFQPLEPEDFALIHGREPTTDTVPTLCSEFTGPERASCWTESWPLVREKILRPDGPAIHCAWLPKAEQSRCLNGLFYVAAAQFNLDFTKISDFCTRTSAVTRDQCFAQSASRLIEVDWSRIDQSVAMCEAAERAGSGPACYRELDFFATFNFPPGSPQKEQLCQQIPAMYRQACNTQ